MSDTLNTLELVPQWWRFRAYQGDAFDFEIVLSVGGQPADVTGWTWAAEIDTGGGTRMAWTCTPTPTGVQLYLRGSETLLLPSRRWSDFDVTGRDPAAGEGRTVLRGAIISVTRVTPPLREAVLA
jgi:hypothetical protein